MLLLTHSIMLKSRPNEISGLEIEKNQFQETQYLGGQLYLVDNYINYINYINTKPYAVNKMLLIRCKGED